MSEVLCGKQFEPDPFDSSLIPISREQQLEAIVSGTFMSLLSQYLPDPTMVDIRKYISVSKEELQRYIEATPSAALEIHSRAKCNLHVHDRFCLEQQGEEYFLYWLDHGKKRFGETFTTEIDALLAYLYKEYGLS